MKNAKLISGLFIMALFFTGCSGIPSYPAVEDQIKAGSITCTVGDTTVVIEPVDAKIPSKFMRGFDSSADTEAAVSYKNTASNDCSIYETLAAFGVNWVRLRVWNDPQNGNIVAGKPAGKSDKAVVVAQAVAAKKAGLKVLLDFHYSDYWADPGKQVIPGDWLSCTTSDAMAAKLSEYTKEVLQAMKDAGAEPNMIQIGNEISSGMLKHKSISEDSTGKEVVTAAASTVAGEMLSDNYFKYLQAGITAAREVCPKAKIMLQFTDIKRRSPVEYLRSPYFEALDYDVVGLSWYPEWASHGTLAYLGEQIAEIKKTYKKEVAVVETNVHHTSESGVLTTEHKANLVDAEGNLYPGILVDSDGNIIASVQNQANIIRAVIEVTAKNGGCGVFEWGGEYLGNWNSMFAGSGAPLPSLAVYGVQ